MKKYLPCLFFLFAFSSLSAQTPFKVVGYLPSYRFSWLNDIEFQHVTHVNISFANPDSLGNFSVGGVSVTNAVQKAHSKGCKVFVSLAGGYLTPNQDATWNYLCQPSNRAFFIQKIVQYVQAKGFDGVDIDLEWQYIQNWYSPFILELKAALAPLGLPLTAALPGSYRYPEITSQALAAFDWINMMVYDLTGPWNPANPGQHSPYAWAQDCIQYWLNQGVPAQKLTLGVPFYGYDFGVNPVTSFTYRYIVSLSTANAQLDQVGDRYYNGIPTIEAKTQLALDQVSGVMIWELGEDAFSANIEYSLLRAIRNIAGPVSDVEDLPADALSVYPNPVQDQLFINIPDGADVRLEILDLQGKLLQSAQTSGNYTVQINTASLHPGMYLLTLSDGKQRKSVRFIKA
jgi:chitinase